MPRPAGILGAAVSFRPHVSNRQEPVHANENPTSGNDYTSLTTKGARYSRVSILLAAG